MRSPSLRICTSLGLLLVASCSFQPQQRVELKIADQTISDAEAEPAKRAIAVLLEQDNVAMVFCRRKDVYEAHAATGTVRFRRQVGADGRYEYPVVEVTGKNPLANQDPKALATVEQELAAGSNPKGTDYGELDPGYAGPDDPRLGFLDPDDVSYPLAYERIAAVFDSERAGDLIIEFKPWGWHPLGERDGVPQPGAHGPLHVVASRAPLIFAGKGVVKNQVIDGWARSVDIAPTVAQALGVEPTFGVDGAGRLTHDVLLKWQDGQVLDKVLDGQRPTHLVIIVNDALTHSELVRQLERPSDDLSTYRWLKENGTMFSHGAIVNFPTNTYASHNTIGSGAYSGHHGLVDNKFFDRLTGEKHRPIIEVFDASDFISDEIETLHQAIHRSFDNWHPDENPLGNFTASFNNPSAKGADLALLEGIQPVGFDRCPEPEVDLPELDESLSDRAQAADNLAITTFYKAYLGHHEIDGNKQRCSQLPRYAIFNFGLTDDTAHRTGSHSDSMARAMAQTNRRHQLVFDGLKRAGVFNNTMFVFTSDHGQTLQDTARNSDVRPALDQAGIRYNITEALIYLLTFAVDVSADPIQRGQRAAISVTVKDDDTGEPVAGATVTVESGEASASETTDEQGRARLSLVAESDQATLRVQDGKRTDHVQTLQTSSQ